MPIYLYSLNHHYDTLNCLYIMFVIIAEIISSAISETGCRIFGEKCCCWATTFGSETNMEPGKALTLRALRTSHHCSRKDLIPWFMIGWWFWCVYYIFILIFWILWPCLVVTQDCIWLYSVIFVWRLDTSYSLPVCWNSIVKLSSYESVLIWIITPSYESRNDYMDIGTFQYSQVIGCWTSEWVY